MTPEKSSTPLEAHIDSLVEQIKNPKESWADRVAREAEETAAAADAVQALCKEWTPTRVNYVLAEVFHRMEGKGGGVGSLYLQWTAECYWHLRFAKLMPRLEKIYTALRDRGITEANKLDFNDADNRVWYEPCDGVWAFCHTSQNHNLLFMWEPRHLRYKPELHVRRYYTVWADRMAADNAHHRQEEEDLKRALADKGMQAVIDRAKYLAAEYADVTDEYPHRLSLDAYRKAGFCPKYGDMRDPGYVLSWDESTGKVDYPEATLSLIEGIEECYVSGIEYALFEEDRSEG